MDELSIEAATASWIGTRSRQEDAVLAHVPPTREPGVIVLSDGMGGHSDGDIASRTIVTEVLADLFLAACRPDALRLHGADILRRAVEAANGRLLDHTRDGAGQEGMGGTLVSGIVQDGALRWVSVGDSPLYLLRGGQLERLNEDHSLAPQIDLMARQGAMTAEDAKLHPQRGILTSALTGGTVAKVDCPAEPISLRPGDLVLFASDGVAAIDEPQLAALLHRDRHRPAQHIADRLIGEVQACCGTDQDNVSVAVVTARARPKPALRAGRPRADLAASLRHQAERMWEGLRARGFGL